MPLKTGRRSSIKWDLKLGWTDEFMAASCSGAHILCGRYYNRHWMHYAEFDCRHGLDHEQNGKNDERQLNFYLTFITPIPGFPATIAT